MQLFKWNVFFSQAGNGTTLNRNGLTSDHGRSGRRSSYRDYQTSIGSAECRPATYNDDDVWLDDVPSIYGVLLCVFNVLKQTVARLHSTH